MSSAHSLRAAVDASSPNDLEAWWLPFTANRAFKQRPRMVTRAKDMHYYTADGRAVLDGAAGLWCCNAGHNREPIVSAIQAQAAELDFSPAFQFGHPKAFALASRIAAVIVEPMAGSTGVLPPPKGYLQRLRQICDKHGILLIFDEVISGFGRLGTAFAAERYGVVPDMITFAKGVNSGTVPMGGVLVRQGLYDAFRNGPDHMIELFHGYTYSGHPLACAAALAAQDIYRDEKLFERAKALEPVWADAIHSLKDLPNVLDIRTIGIVAAIDLASRPDGVGKRAYEAMDRAFQDFGLMMRVTGDTIALSPPLIITEEQIGEIVEKLTKVIKAVA